MEVDAGHGYNKNASSEEISTSLLLLLIVKKRRDQDKFNNPAHF